MFSIWNLLSRTCTIRTHRQNRVPDIWYDVRRCSSLRPSRDGMAECANPYFNRWDHLHRTWVADVLIFHRDTFIVQVFYAHKISILGKSKKVAGAIIFVSFTASKIRTLKEIFRCTQLSFVQLLGGIAVGVYAEQKKYYSLVDITHKTAFVQGTSIGVRKATFQVCSQIFNNITPQIWNVGSVLCDIIIAVCMTYYVGFPKPSLIH